MTKGLIIKVEHKDFYSHQPRCQLNDSQISLLFIMLLVCSRRLMPKSMTCKIKTMIYCDIWGYGQMY